jgi:hypothetical protein
MDNLRMKSLELAIAFCSNSPTINTDQVLAIADRFFTYSLKIG